MKVHSSIKLTFIMLLMTVMVTGVSAKPFDDSKNRMNADTFKGLALRSIGPAFLSGRITELVIHPADESIWYVAAGSGGVWKSVNDGVTFTPVFEDQGSYSIGTVATDPGNKHVIWVGTGEASGSRHIGYGDGIYRSGDGGKNWQNMGLKNSQHIGRIIVSSADSNIIYVAAQGPLWSKGGDRGFFKSIDGGKSWKKTLGDDEWTGVADIVVDPRDPNRIYAATWQHHRNVAAYMGGGIKSAIYLSDDGGETWAKLSSGLPQGKMGKIGLAISSQQPDVVYATIELNRRQGGFYRSSDRGQSWVKQSNKNAAATGPHYYQKIFASPHQFDKIYMTDEYMAVSLDGGASFNRMGIKDRYGDSHAIAFKNSDPNYILVGDDGGVYESFDQEKNWRFIENLPLAQFYKVAVDDAAPFYNIYGGTQDRGSQGGPSRTDKVQGIQSSEWISILDWDGHQPATEPGNPDIVYAERQEGHLTRIDMTTGEFVAIQPQPDVGENYERFNWDSPILVSPHSPTRLYFASQRLWRSDNRGDAWTAISGDLTKNQDRMNLPIMDRQQSWDSGWDLESMSNYNTITSISESPQVEGLIYVGTDDGLVQVTENSGKSWRKLNVSKMPGVPDTAFINDIKADLHDANTVYVVLDNHKFGDFTPYLLKSVNRGASWKSIRSDLPDRGLVWRIVQDHLKPELLFVGTEFGIYFSVNAGEKWVKLAGGVPTISFRDLAIQKRENDLVGASFGRGFFVLDDYSALREVSEKQLAAEATLFPTRDALWYIPRNTDRATLGSTHYAAPNPEFGAVFTYHLRDGLKSKKQSRQASEKPDVKANKDIAFPGWDALDAEMTETDPSIWIIIKDTQGNLVRRVKGSINQGINRVAWDLRYPAPEAVRLGAKPQPSGRGPSGLLAAPGSYSASLAKEVDGVFTTLQFAIQFDVVPLKEGALRGNSNSESAAFWRSYEDAARGLTAVNRSIGSEMNRVEAMRVAIERSKIEPGKLDQRLNQLRGQLLALEEKLYGNRAKRQVGEKWKPNVNARLSSIELGISRSTYGPTATHRKNLKIVNAALEQIISDLEKLRAQSTELGEELMNAGAPSVGGNR